ncbi:hypothetical protein JCM18903_810 [Psychrobacter sp. JCM 18903]|nr:hypothetical protein JCM18903_810 [Psychrobacter sp. JCM 18903]
MDKEAFTDTDIKDPNDIIFSFIYSFKYFQYTVDDDSFYKTAVINRTHQNTDSFHYS